jgi:hypothetical protein
VTLAVHAGADLLVSGDFQLTGLGEPSVPVATPRAFLERLQAYQLAITRAGPPDPASHGINPT